jgi:AGZA family xanthine/uracil permease-like MFS transporter
LFEKLFKLKENKTTIRTEILAGLTTFMTMAYIIVVNPGIISDTGMPFEGVMIATILSAAFATLLMGLLANYPFALAPGMGLNAYFTYSVVLGMGYSWQVALGAVFLSGVIFILLSLFKVREMIIDAVPLSVRFAISSGIGLFIAFIGLKNAGIIVADSATFIKLGNITSGTALLAIIGLTITGVLLSLKIRGGILYGILGTTLIGAIFFPELAETRNTVLNPLAWISMPNWRSFGDIFMKLDIRGALNIGFFNIIFAFLFVDLFDTIGTLIGISERAGFLKNGKLERGTEALLSDAVGTVAGSFLGTPTVTSYIESAAGVAYGGRTGLTAVSVAFFFLLSLFFSPLASVIPAAATSPALIVVGVMMMGNIGKIDWDDFSEALPAFIAMVAMPFTFSIANGIALAFILYPIIKLVTGKGKDVHFLAYILCALFIIKFAFLG